MRRQWLGSGGGLCYTPYVGGNLTSSESALVQEIQALVAINSQLNEAVEQQQRDEQVRVQHISPFRKVCNEITNMAYYYCM